MSTIEQRMQALEARVAELEARDGAPSQPAAPLPHAQPTDLSLVQVLQQRSGPPYEDGDTRGAVVYAGAVHMPNLEYVWQIERPLPGLLALDVTTLAPVLAALGSAPRLQLLRALLEGPRSSQQLQEALGVSSPGQLYHHLKELLAAGIVEQPERSVYRLSPRKVVPFLALIGTAYDLGGDSSETNNATP